MKKSIVLVLISLILVGTLMTACSKKQAEPIVTIEWWTIWEPDFADAMIADFEAENPNIKVNRTQHGDPGIWDAMAVATATKAGPDIFFNWNGNYQESFYRKGGAISLDDYSKQYGWGDRFLPSAAEVSSYDGHLILIPYLFNAVGVVYKKSTFEQYGLKEPTTYAELSTVCDTLAKNGVLPYSIGGMDSWHTACWTYGVFEQFCGPELHDRLLDFMDTGVSWDCPEVIAAFTEMSTWISRGWVDPNFAGVAEADAFMPIYAGRAAMNVTGDWAEEVVRDAGFDTADFGFFPIPRDSGPGRMGVFTAGVGLTGYNGKERTDAAAKFIDFMLKPAAVDKFIPLKGSLSGIKGAPIDPSAAIVQQVAKYMAERGSYPVPDGILPEETIEVYYRTSTEVILGTMSPQEAARLMADSIESARATS